MDTQRCPSLFIDNHLVGLHNDKKYIPMTFVFLESQKELLKIQ